MYTGGILYTRHGVDLLNTDKWHYSADDFIELQLILMRFMEP